MKPSWLAYIGTFLAVLAFGWSIASAWFGLERRLALIEAQQRFLHGDVRAFMKE